MSQFLYVYLAPRANSDVDGHFYWFLYRVISYFKENEDDALILVPESSKIDVLYELVKDSKVHIVPVKDSAEWGYDIGKIRPLRLSKLIVRTIANSSHDVQKHKNILFLCNESSLASMLSVVILVLRNPSYRAMINLLDIGFWQKLIASNHLLQFCWKLVLRIIIENKRILITTNSPVLLRLIRGQGLSSAIIWKYYQLTNPSSSPENDLPSHRTLEKNVKLIKVLVLPWPGYSHEVIFAMKELIENINFRGSVQIHLKMNDSIDSYLDLAASLQVSKERLFITQGTLDEAAYASLLRDSTLIWFPYSSNYHAQTGSGRAIDALASGTPILIDKESNLFSVLDSFVLDFVFSVDCSDAPLVAEKCMNSLDELKQRFSDPQTEAIFKGEISKRVKIQFSAKSMIDEVTSNLRKKSGKEESKVMSFLLSICLEGYFVLIYTLNQIKDKFWKDISFIQKS